MEEEQKAAVYSLCCPIIKQTSLNHTSASLTFALSTQRSLKPRLTLAATMKYKNWNYSISRWRKDTEFSPPSYHRVRSPWSSPSGINANRTGPPTKRNKNKMHRIENMQKQYQKNHLSSVRFELTTFGWQSHDCLTVTSYKKYETNALTNWAMKTFVWCTWVSYGDTYMPTALYTLFLLPHSGTWVLEWMKGIEGWRLSLGFEIWGFEGEKG